MKGIGKEESERAMGCSTTLMDRNMKDTGKTI